jgi:hypothetical protein
MVEAEPSRVVSTAELAVLAVATTARRRLEWRRITGVLGEATIQSPESPAFFAQKVNGHPERRRASTLRIEFKTGPGRPVVERRGFEPLTSAVRGRE